MSSVSARDETDGADSSALAALARRWIRAGGESRLAAVPWRVVFLWAVSGWLVGLALLGLDYSRSRDALGPLVVTEPIIPAAPVIEADLGPDAINFAGPHDGAFYYVLARNPLDLSSAAESLDRPRYRAQRVLFPVLAWVVHPSNGEGLVRTLFALGAIGVLAGAVAMGALSSGLGGKPLVGALFPVLSGSVTSLRITTPDPMALAFALWAVFFVMKKKTGWAVAFGVAAVLTKETTLLIFIGYLLWERHRRALLLVAIPAVVGAGWWLYLRVSLPQGNDADVIEFTVPFRGWARSIEYWVGGGEREAMLWFAVAVVIGMAALAVGRLRHPLGWVVLLQLLLLVPLIASAIGPVRSAGRTTLPLLAVAIVVLATANRPLPEPAGASSDAGCQDA